MFRTPRYLEKTEYIRFNLNTPLTFPGNNQHQNKGGKKFYVQDRDNVYDWYNAYFRVDFTFEALADGANVAANTASAPINSAFSLIKDLTVTSAGKVLYNAADIHKVIFIKNLLDYSDDFARSVAKSQFWYLDSDATNVTAAAGTNAGAKQRGGLSHGGLTVETIIPLNRYSFFEELSDRLLPPIHLEIEITLQSDNEMIFQNDGTGRRIVVRKFELWVPRLTLTSEGQKMFNENFLKPAQWTYLREMLHPSSSRGEASGSWLITAGVKNPKHVFIFFQQTQKQNSLEHNPYIFDTFDLDGDDSAKLDACRLQYGSSYIPGLDYESDFKLRIFNDLTNYRYRKNDYNSGTQIQVANFSSIYPILYFDLRSSKESVTGDSKNLTLHYRLNEAADAHDYTIFAAVLNEEEVVVKQIGNELVVV